MRQQLRSMALAALLPSMLTVGCGGEQAPTPPEATKASVAALNPGCTGSPSQVPGTTLWAQIYGDAQSQHGRQVAVAPSGDVLATGQFLGNVSFGTTTLVNAGGDDAWLTKLSSTGVPTWSFNFGSSAAPPLYTYGLVLATDASGNAFLAGQLTGSADLGGGTLTSAGSDDVFITKRDANGAHLWSKRYGDSAAQYVLGEATDASGNLFVVGYFAGTIDFGTGPLTSAGGMDIYIAKLDGATGNGIWARRYGDASVQHAWGVGVDAAGGVTFAGNFTGTVDFGGGPYQSPGASDFDAYAVHLDSAGNHVWTRRFGGTGSSSLACMTVDSAGNTIISGSFLGSLNVGATPLTASNLDDAFLAKLDPSGNTLWSLAFPGNDFQRIVDVATDSAGNIVAVARLKGDGNFGGGLLTSAGDEDLVIAEYSPSGAHIFSKRYGDLVAQTATGVAVDANDDIVVSAGVFGTTNLGTGNLTSAGSRDILLAKVAGARCLDPCLGQPDGTACDDGNACTTGDSCQAGVCVSSGGCDDGNGCTDDVCDPVNGCVHVNNTASCNDGDACTTGDVCQAGVCAGVSGGDADGDGICAGLDNCPTAFNPSQTDGNADGIGDACTPVCVAIQRGVNGTMEDTGVRSGAPTTVYGAATDILAGNSGFPLFRADLSVIPANAQIVSAGLTMVVSSTTAATLEVRRVTAPWSEATTTWNTFASAYDATVWTSIGNGAPITLGAISADILPLVQAWYAGTYTNNGLLIKPLGAGTTKVATSESVNVSHRPVMNICYTVPEPPSLCAVSPNGTPCDDGNGCTTNDACSNGACVGGAPLGCDDGNVCTDDTCDAANGCVHTNNTAPCDDGDACSTGDVCQGGVCTGNAQADVDGDGVCPSADNCPNDYNPSQADANGDGQGDACTPVCLSIQRGVSGTMEDTGVRSGTPTTTYGSATDILAGTSGYPLFRADLSAIPANVQVTSATLSTVVTSTAVATFEVHRITAPWVEATTTWNSFGSAYDASVITTIGNGAPITLGTISYNILPLVQAWYAGTYTNHGLLIKPISGTTTKVATSESVNVAHRPVMTVCYTIPEPPSVCAGAPNGTACDDGNACTANDACANGVCAAGPAVNCDDGNGCTDDACDPASGCSYANNAAACDDGDSCTQGDVCAGGSCVAGGPVACDDGNACTDDTCDSLQGGCVFAANTLACDDGDPCTASDSCEAGACVGTPLDVCDPCLQPGSDGVTSDDGDGCTQGDVCTAGVCVGVGADSDVDGVCDALDNCPSTYNPLQADANVNGQGDACEVVCQTFQRGVLGSFADTTVNSSTPTTPAGIAPSVKAGAGFGNKWYALFRVDLSSLPLTAQVVSSTLTVNHTSTFALQVNAHRITSSWIESIETWNTFASAFSPAIEASAVSVPPSGTMSFDITSLTQQWRDLTVANYGVLLEQAQGTTFVVSSEVPTISTRPSLTVCFVIPDASCVDGETCDDGDGCTTDDVCHLGICSGNPSADSDGDGVCDPVDNCYDVPNAAQVDTNGDGTGDACNNCTDVATTDTVSAILAARVLCNDEALASGPSTCPVPMTPSCAGSLVDDVLALAYGDNNQAVAAVDPVAMTDQIACQTAIGAAVNGYVSTKLHELEIGSDESVAEAAAVGNLTPILTACNVTVAQDQTGVLLPSVGPQCAVAVGAMGDDVDADRLHDCLHTLLDVWVQRFGPNPQPLRPNILLIMVDDMRWDQVGPIHTPSGDNMSHTLQEIRDQGINLSNAYATTPLCCPSRSTVLTGAYAHTHGVVDNGTVSPVSGGASAFPDASTLATTLQAAGYRTGLVGKYLNNYTLMWSNGQPPYIPPGWDDWYGMKQHLYYNYQLVERPKGGAAVEVSYGSTPADYSTDVIREKTKAFITAAAAGNQPFFFFTSFNAPHSPHPGAAPRHLGLFAGLTPWQPPNFNEADVSDKPAWLRNNKPLISLGGLLVIDDERRDEGEMLLSVDEAIGGSVTYGITGIIDTLKATGVYDNTVIIFMSDHGYFWAEHRLAGKPFVYQEDARIPLLIRYPRLIPLPRQDASLIVTNDLAPTLIELAGAQPLPSSDGKSAVRVLDGTMHNGRSDFMLEGWNNDQEFAAVHDGRWKYVEYSPQAGGDIELYDLENDPYEMTSLHADPLQAPRIQAMHIRLMQLRPNWPADAP